MQVQLFTTAGETPADLHAAALALFEEMHALPVHQTEERAQFYRERIEGNAQFLRLRESFDTWCALWFWPVDKLEHFPLPEQLAAPGDEARAIVSRLRERHHFFHWELEFPDVFTVAGSGFDAMLGNPPWELQKPNSKEFFSNHDPLYRTYSKDEARGVQRSLFQSDAEIERNWIDYSARFKAMGNWCAHTAFPWGDPSENEKKKFTFPGGSRQGAELHAQWRIRRATRRGFADAEHPFRHQGTADLNSYKLFLEQMHALLRRGGRLGVIVPSNVYTDKGSTKLRTLFLDHCRWEWLLGFENRERLFDIDARFKFCPLVIAKGGQTASIRTAFMRRQLADWENAERNALSYTRAQVERFSPATKTILEVRRPRDIELLQGMYDRGAALGNLGLDYGREFHMSDDSALFPPRPDWEARGYIADEYGHWLQGNWQPWTGTTGHHAILNRPPGFVLSRDNLRAIRVEEIEDVALPLYEGRMIDHFDYSAAGWVRGQGRGAKWREIPWQHKQLEPHFLMGIRDSRRKLSALGPKVGQMRVTSATNSRTLIVAFVDSMPCGDKVVTIREHNLPRLFSMVGILNSLGFDWQARFFTDHSG